MYRLAFDTCFGACSVALIDPGGSRPIVSRYEEIDTGHAERLMPMIREVLAEAGVAFGSVEGIAVTIGPGTFTGVRTGIAAARGFALAKDLPVLGTTSLALMAARACAELGEEARETPIAVCVDARRTQLYFQVFGPAARDARSQPSLLTAEDAVRMTSPGPLIAVGSGAAAFARAAADAGLVVPASLPMLQPDACYFARVSLDRLQPPRPLYLRAPDAKPQMRAIPAKGG